MARYQTQALQTQTTGRACRLGNFCAVVCLFLGLVVGVFAKPVAAGCSYTLSAEQTVFSGGEEGRVAEYYPWTKGPVIRVYRDGQFKYYQAPVTADHHPGPCDGPACHGRSQPKPTLETVMNFDSLRLPVATCNLPAPQRPPALRSKCVLGLACEWQSPELAGPLRPPC